MSASPSGSNRPGLIIALDGKTISESTDVIAELARIQQETKDRLDITVKFNDLLPTVSYKELAEIMAQHPELGVFLDPKWHDIAPTNHNHLKRLTESGLVQYVRYLTMHPESFANPGDYKKTIAPLLQQNPELRTLAITFLTTLGDREARKTHGKPAKGVVLDNAHLALSEGFSGTVSSAEEASMILDVFGRIFGDISVVTPGIRFAGNDAGGAQKRVTTPAQARKNGATAQVLGTDILRNPDLSVRDAIMRFVQEVEGVTYIHAPTPGIDARLEELVRMGSIPEILAYIGATYDRPDDFPAGHGYIRWDSGVITNKYTNLSVLEKHPQVLERVSRDMADRLEQEKIVPQMVIGAAMGSVRLSGSLAQMLGVPSIYAEKAKDGSMEFNRHDIPEGPIDVVICEDTISKGGTVERIIEALRKFPNVRILGVTSVARNTVNEVDFGVPFISLTEIPKPAELYHDEVSFINAKTGDRKPEADCDKLKKNPIFPASSELVGSGKPYVKQLQRIVREGKGQDESDFAGIVSQK